MVSHIAATVLTAYVIYLAVPGSSLFSWHPTLMCVAFVLLMFEAILVFNAESSLMASYSRTTKAEVHGWVIAVAAVCASCGFAAIYVNKDLNQKPHFTTWHGFIGVLTLSYVVLQMFGGIFLKYNSILRKLKIQIRLADLKVYHATSGLVAFTAVSVSLILAMWSDWFTSRTNLITWYLSFMCLSCVSLIVMLQITSTYLPQAKQPRLFTDLNKQMQSKKQKKSKQK